jgi:hypothetical protein
VLDRLVFREYVNVLAIAFGAPRNVKLLALKSADQKMPIVHQNVPDAPSVSLEHAKPLGNVLAIAPRCLAQNLADFPYRLLSCAGGQMICQGADTRSCGRGVGGTRISVPEQPSGGKVDRSGVWTTARNESA